MKRIIITLTLIGSLAVSLMAQTESTDPKLVKLFEKSMTISKFMAQKDEDFWKSAKGFMYQNQGFDDGHGMYAWPPAMKSFPKRVGLLSFMVFDPGFFETTSKTFGYVTLVKTQSGFMKASTTQELARGMYEMSIASLKKDFENYGSTLLTPEEFLTTDALREAYRTFDFKEKGLARMMSSESSANVLSVPEGFFAYYAENMTMPAYVDAITAKIRELGLDAAIIIKIQMGAVDETISLQSVSMAMYGPNPVPKDPNKKYVAINPATGYHDGVVYNAVKMGAFDTDNMLETKEGLNILLFARNKNGELSDFNGLDRLLAKICSGNTYCFNMWITGAWKPFKYK